MFKEVLTDPKNHDPNNFVYITHSLVNWVNEDLNLNTRVSLIFFIISFMPTQNYSASLIGRMPQEIALVNFGYGKKIEQLATFFWAGLILKPPEESIYVAWNCDLGRPTNPIKFNKWAEKHKGKIRSPKTLLTKSWFDFHNEMVIHGDERTLIDGVFYLNNGNEPKEFGYTLKRITEEMTQKEIPIIPIPYRNNLNNNQILKWLEIYGYKIMTDPTRIMFYCPKFLHKIFRKDYNFKQ